MPAPAKTLVALAKDEAGDIEQIARWLEIPKKAELIRKIESLAREKKVMPL